MKESIVTAFAAIFVQAQTGPGRWLDPDSSLSLAIGPFLKQNVPDVPNYICSADNSLINGAGIVV